MGFFGWFLVVVRLIGLIAALTAAVFWFSASATGIPENQDTFIRALQESSRLNAYAAMAAGFGAICGLILFIEEWWPMRWR